MDTIACISVNDAFVMGAWGTDQKAGDKGLTLDASKAGLGTRSQRYATIVEDGVIKDLFVERPGACESVDGRERAEAPLGRSRAMAILWSNPGPGPARNARLGPGGPSARPSKARWPWIVVAVSGAGCLFLAIAVLSEILQFG